jgi:PAS domain S-box-containing protein
VARDLQAVLASDATQANDVRVIRKDGSVLFADIHGRRFELNSRVCLIGSFRDITERKAVQQGLVDALAFNARLLTCAPVGILTYKTTGECVSCNDAAAEIVGGTAEQLKGQNFRTLDSWKRSGLLHMAERVIATRRIEESDVHILTTFGQDRWLTVRMSLFKSKDEDLLLLIANDVSLRKRAEEGRERLVAILDATPDFVAIGDLEGRLLYLNTSGRGMLGLEADQDLSGLRVADGHPDWARRQVLEIGIPTAVRDGSWQGMGSLLDREGREIPLSQVILAHKGPDGQVAFLSTIMRDLREQRALEAQLQQSQRLEAVGRLAGGVAHDFNNLLTVITGYGEMMRREIPEGNPARPRLEEVIKAGERAAGLTRQLLAFSRKQVMQPKLLDLNSVVQELKKMLDRVVGEDVDINVQTASDLGTVKADPTQIEQVIMNLVVNARDAMPNGGHLTIETANTEIDDTYAASHPPAVPGRFVMLAVSDTGVGIDAETQRRIFEPFFTTKPDGKGSGLGLATVYGIVKQSGGYIWIYSEVGQGTTFKIYLPRVDEACAVDGPAAAVVDAPRGDETVLVVEDMENVREMIRQVLEESGYTVLLAAHGEEALALVRERRSPIHLLLTDVVLPKLGGRGLAEQMLALRPGTPVLYMSGYTNGAVTHGGALDEGIALIEKPFTPARLAHAVRKALDSPKGV